MAVHSTVGRNSGGGVRGVPGGTFSVPHSVVLIPEFLHRDGMVSLHDLAEGVIAPADSGRAEGGAADTDAAALVDVIHGVTILRKHSRASFVLFDVEAIAIGEPGVGPVWAEHFILYP